MFRKIYLVLVVVLAMLILTFPVNATSSNSRIKIIDNTTFVTLCDQTAPSSCANISLTAGDLISFEVLEQTGAASNYMTVIGSHTNASWNNRGWGMVWTGVGTQPTCTYTDTTSRWQLTCTSTSNNITGIELWGEPTSAADDNGVGQVRITGLTPTNVFFNYVTP